MLVLWCLMGLAGAAERPQRVVSVNLCSDQLLVMLADADQIASISHLAMEPLSSYVADEASRFPLNHARAEEVIALRPDLVLATSHDQPRLLTTLETLGYRVARLPPTENLAGIVDNIRRVAGLLHQTERGERLVRSLEARIGAGDETPFASRPTALFYQPRGYTSGRHTLQDEALRLAGWRNLAAEQGIEGYAPVDLERLLRWRPQQLFTSSYHSSGDSLAERQLLHPALASVTGGRALQTVPYRYWICPGPMLADAVVLLREARNRLSPPGGTRQ